MKRGLYALALFICTVHTSSDSVSVDVRRESGNLYQFEIMSIANAPAKVKHKAPMIPDFWLPPFVGPYALKKQIRSQLQYTAHKTNYLLALDAH